MHIVQCGIFAFQKSCIRVPREASRNFGIHQRINYTCHGDINAKAYMMIRFVLSGKYRVSFV
jgi:hypothetical protein